MLLLGWDLAGEVTNDDYNNEKFLEMNIMLIELEVSDRTINRSIIHTKYRKAKQNEPVGS